MGGVHSPGSWLWAAQSLGVSWSPIHGSGRAVCLAGWPSVASSAHPGRVHQRCSFRRLQRSRVWLAIMYF